MTLERFLEQAGSGHGALVALGVTFLAGIVASAVCPCTLPVGLGMAGAAGASEAQSRKTGFRIAAAFFAGIVLNLTILGGLAGRLGALATEAFGRYWALGMAILSLAAALFVFWGPRTPVSQVADLRRPGLFGAFSYGFIFSLGTSVAPLLLLLAVSAGSANPAYGLLLAFTFGLGRGLPFLLVGVVASSIMRLARVGAAWRRVIQVASGCALLFVSGYYVNTFVVLR